MTDYLTIADVIMIHDEQVIRYGGGTGLRDPGQLESALFRPQTGYYADLIAEAAALWESLAQNHAFVDGNKRTAFAAMYVFLDINGFDVTATPQNAFDFIVGCYETRTMNFETLDAWLRANTTER